MCRFGISARSVCCGVVLLTVLSGALAAGEGDGQKRVKEVKSVLELTVKDNSGRDVKLSDFAGDVILIVNVASKCGLTDGHYKQLQPLYEKYKERGFRILAFPANNFARQEPGTDEEIRSFCSAYGVTFDLFSKVSVKGGDICPLYSYLTNHPDKQIAGKVAWNFQKYLVSRDGKVMAKFHPKVNPNDPKLISQLEEALKAPRPKDKGSGA